MLRAFFLIKKQALKTALQYPVNFLLDIFGVGLNGFAEVLVIFLLTSAFHAVGGWDFWQIGFMAGIWRLAHSLHHALFLEFNGHHELVRDGEYDTLLVRPAPPLLQIIARGLPLEAVGELLPAAALFALTCGHVKVPWNLGNILFLGLVIVSGALIQWAVNLLFATFDFWFPENSKMWVSNTFLFPTARYPLHIYGRVFANLLTFVFPFGFIAYYPAYHFFQLPSHPLLPYLSPLVALLSLAIAFTCWSAGLRHYQSTGT
jgi:ABC-2 type transport system permease protein